MSLNPRQTNDSSIQIRYIDPETVTDPALTEAMMSWLDQTEQARYQRFKQSEHRHAFLVSHALTRKMLADQLFCSPAEIRFGVTGREKPILTAPTSTKPLHFNLTHTRGLAAVALSTDPIGVDVECLVRNTPGPELAQRYFTLAEQADIQNQPQAQQKQRFLTYWTLKEAFLKAQAWGIVDSLNGFEFEFTPPVYSSAQRIRLRVLDAKLSPTQPWRFHHCAVTSDHLLSVAFSARLGAAVEIDLRAWSAEDWGLGTGD
jgi:4'-phosphopantetheinyl transferase